MPTPELRYGFTPAQVVRICAICGAFVTLMLLSALALRRTLLNSPATAEERWTRFERTRAKLAMAVWLCWPAILVYGDGLPILRLAIGGEEYIGTGAASILALVPLLAVQGISAALLAPVYWRLRGVEATRSQIGRAASGKAAIWAPAAAHALALADPLHRVDVGTLIVLFAVVQALEFVLFRKWLSATGARGTTVIGGALKTRTLELAFELKAKVPKVYLIPDGPWKWRQLYSVGNGSIAIPAAAIEKLNRREMDAAILRQIIWLHEGNHRKLMLLKSVGAFGVFLAGCMLNGWLGPLGTILFVRCWWIGLDHRVVLAMERMDRKADGLALKTLHAPESLITSIVKLEGMLLHAPDLVSRKRLESIAKQAEVDEETLTALMQQPDGTHDRYPSPQLSPSELAVVA